MNTIRQAGACTASKTHNRNSLWHSSAQKARHTSAITTEGQELSFTARWRKLTFHTSTSTRLYLASLLGILS